MGWTSTRCRAATRPLSSSRGREVRETCALHGCFRGLNLSLVHWRAKTCTDPRRVLPSCAEWSGPVSLAFHMSLWDSGTFYPRVRGETGCHVSLLVSLWWSLSGVSMVVRVVHAGCGCVFEVTLEYR